MLIFKFIVIKKSGFTLIELLVVIGIIAILSTVVIVAINPARQFAQARNTQRSSNVTALLNAINQNMVDNRGIFTCAPSGPIPTTTVNIATSTFHLGDCLVPNYLPILPFDPSAPGAHYTDTSDYDLGYSVIRDSQGRITVSAPSAELEATISVTR